MNCNALMKCEFIKQVISLVLQVAIGLRSASRGYIPDKAFIIVTLAVTAFLLIGWRTGLAALSKVSTASFAAQACTLQQWIVH